MATWEKVCLAILGLVWSIRAWQQTRGLHEMPEIRIEVENRGDLPSSESQVFKFGVEGSRGRNGLLLQSHH